MKQMIIGLALIFAVVVLDSIGQELKYCKDYETGEVVVVEAGKPCPFPMGEL